MDSGDLKRHEPTPRRLEQLRRAGAGPRSPLLTGAVVLVGLTALGWGLAGPLLRLLGGLLARDLQYGARTVADRGELAGLMAGHLAVTIGLLAALGGATLLLVQLGQSWQSGGQLPGGAPATSLWADSRRARRRPERPGVADKLAAVAAAVLLVWVLLGRLAGAVSWDEIAAGGGWADLGGRALAVLAGLGLVHWLVQRQRFHRRAMMSDRELTEEKRQTEGAAITRQRRQAARLGRR